MANSSSEPKPFGGPIEQRDAQRMYLNFYKIKKRSLDLMQQAFPNDSEALRYHGGRYEQMTGAAPGQQFACSFLDMSFVFDRQSIDRLMSSSPDGIVIFLGSRNMEDSLGDSNSTADKSAEPCFLDVDGRPTLLAFPFTYATGEEPTWKDNNPASIVIQLDDGEEHPGTGGGGVSGGGIKLAVGPQPNEVTLPIPRAIPETYQVHDIEHLSTK
jgi:hypothetical protein